MGKKGLRKRPQTPRKRYDFSRIRGLLARWGLTIGVSVWMFVLGVLVGRGTMPIRFETGGLQRELARLRQADQQVQVRQLENESKALFADAPDLDFHEELRDDWPPISSTDAPPSDPEGEDEGNDPETQDGVIENKTPLLKKRPQDRGDRRDRIQEEDISAQTPAEVARRTPEPHDAPKPDPEPRETVAAPPISKPASDGELTVQVASFRNSGDAESLVAALKERAYPAYRIAGIIPEKGIWHRVRVGRFKDRADAQAMVNRLRRDQHQAFVVQRTER